jgi:large subunit ribosomal protein L24
MKMVRGPSHGFKKMIADKRARVAEQLLPEWNIVKGDKVRVISGSCEGEEGVIKTIRRKRNQVFVVGVNVSVNTSRPMQSKNGYFYRRESPIDVTNVALIDPSTNQPTSVRRLRQEDGKRVRVAMASHTVVPEHPYKRKDRRINSATDTPFDVVNEVTYVPRPAVKITRGVQQAADEILAKNGFAGASA